MESAVKPVKQLNRSIASDPQQWKQHGCAAEY